jgi:hypothetical protein
VNREAAMMRLAALAIEAGSYPALRQNRYSRNAYVPWRVIHQIRAACDEAGVDWRKVKSAGGSR